ncbi:MAG TPA: Holliday junction branch migration protein RuvA [Chitinophagaceae bacterium]|jgi:Holliday junction DNA helicase RuvA|nr:Holliday junction branch migration protein RuvA [Chitinophagaceae bacterium]
MIAFLRGKFVHKSPASVQVDVNGVGYELQISLHTYTHIQQMEEGLLHTHLQFREDGQTLYGFADTQEKEMFIQLISVSGVGASTARMMLSSLKPGEIAQAIARGDAKQLEMVKGIGKKSAERIILELKDKMAKWTPSANIPALIHNSLEQDALNALIALGIPRSGAEQAVKKVMKANENLNQVEDIIKNALKML